MEEVEKATTANIFAYMSESKTKLFTIQDLADEWECEFRTIQNITHNLRLKGKIDRHIDRDKNKNFRFAVLISPDKVEPYVPMASKTKNNSDNNIKKKKRGQLLSGKEIRSMFAAHYNNMAKLEDSVMAIIERSEMTEKEMTKIRNFLKS